MTETLLAGVRVVDLAGEPAAMTGRILADLGATVTLVEPPGGHPLRADPHRFAAWSLRKRIVEVTGPGDGRLAELLAAADVVVATPGWPGVLPVDAAAAPDAVWVDVTPFGRGGPRRDWRASDLGVMAASGNLYCTGDPDRPPVRCREPASEAHVGPEAAFAALTGLASGRPQHVDVSMQEAALVANMTTPALYPKTGFRGARRGAAVGRTREIWRARDGFVSFGLRGGKARIPSLETLTRVVDTPTLRAMDWAAFSPATTDDETLRAIERDLASFFAARSMVELYTLAVETGLMLAPVRSPREILACEQLAARGFFEAIAGYEQVPRSFVVVRPGSAAAERPSPAAPERPGGARAWAGLRILELGSGAAGPIATRYFAEHGATVLRIESRRRPDFLRVYALGPHNPDGLEGAPMYDGLNVGKRHATFDLAHPEAVELVRRLAVEWADAVAENFAPRAMRRFGLDYESLVAYRPDLVMVSACLNGQTGPHRDYPGFGGQGSALSGYNFLTGWPDRAPVGPHGTITDSLAPRFVAVALAAALLHRDRTGQGAYLDLSQVEAAVYTLSPWLLEHQATGVVRGRAGNDDERAVVHGVFACADEGDVADRWIAIVAWTDADAARLRAVTGDDLSAWTAARARAEVGETLQGAGVEAVPVADFGDLHADPQLEHRGHFVPLTHPVMGPGLYERNGFRLSDTEGGYERSGPTLGQDQDWVLHELLGLSRSGRAALEARGVFE